MKNELRGILLLCAVLFLNIVFMQGTIFYFYYEKYVLSLLFIGFNILLFPIAIWIYQREKEPKIKGEQNHEK